MRRSITCKKLIKKMIYKQSIITVYKLDIFVFLCFALQVGNTEILTLLIMAMANRCLKILFWLPPLQGLSHIGQLHQRQLTCSIASTLGQSPFGCQCNYASVPLNSKRVFSYKIEYDNLVLIYSSTFYEYVHNKCIPMSNVVEWPCQSPLLFMDLPDSWSF